MRTSEKSRHGPIFFQKSHFSLFLGFSPFLLSRKKPDPILKIAGDKRSPEITIYIHTGIKVHEKDKNNFTSSIELLTWFFSDNIKFWKKLKKFLAPPGFEHYYISNWKKRKIFVPTVIRTQTSHLEGRYSCLTTTETH